MFDTMINRRCIIYSEKVQQESIDREIKFHNFFINNNSIINNIISILIHISSHQ